MGRMTSRVRKGNKSDKAEAENHNGKQRYMHVNVNCNNNCNQDLRHIMWQKDNGKRGNRKQDFELRR